MGSALHLARSGEGNGIGQRHQCPASRRSREGRQLAPFDVGLYVRMALYALVAVGLTLLMGFAGQISSGSVAPGEEVRILPSGRIGRIDQPFQLAGPHQALQQMARDLAAQHLRLAPASRTGTGAGAGAPSAS